MLFAAFWMGGQVAVVLVLWAEWYGDRDFPPSVRALNLPQLLLAVFFAVGFWPGFIVMVALKKREWHDERQRDAELNEELARRYPETHGPGVIAGQDAPMLCKYPCTWQAGATALCPWCDRYSHRQPLIAEFEAALPD